jgi:diguanylate cyclase (GGDEF)-like protein
MQQAEAGAQAIYPQTALVGRQQWWRRIRVPVAAIALSAAWLGRTLRGCLARSSARPLLPELAAIFCFLTLMWASILVALNHEYHVAEVSAVQATGNLARAFEESTRRTIDEVDQTLLSVRAFYSAQGQRFDFAAWAHTQTLPDKMTTAIWMVDRTGLTVAGTLPVPPHVSIADRPHFRAQLDPTHDDLFISRPVRGRVSGTDTIQFSRKLLDARGEFAGVTVLSLGCDALSRFYQTLDLGGGFVALLSTDGTILARGPLVPGMIDSEVKVPALLDAILHNHNGPVRFRSQFTGADDIASFRRLQDYPVVVMVGFDTGSVFGQYRSLRQRTLLTGGAVTLAIGVIGLLWLVQKRRSVASRRALTITLETISQGILMVDAHGRVPVVNPRALDLLELDDATTAAARKRAASRATELAIGHAANGARRLPVTGIEAAGEAHQVNRFDTVRADGTIIEVSSHALPDGGFVHTYTDVTDQRMADARVRYLAHYDTLTGLANRVQLRQCIREFIEQPPNAVPTGAPPLAAPPLTAFVMIDLDGFKGVNDTLGHDVGDELLVVVARRLQALVREGDFVARLGGDEFIIVQPGLAQPEDAAPLAQRVLQQLAEPAQVGDHQVRIGASIGIAFHPTDGLDGDALLKHADIALYCAKADGRGLFRNFDVRMTYAVNEHRLLESGLRRVLDNRELEVHFQPIFNCESLEVTGFEALARWRHPTRGYIPPDVFIRIAEECGLIGRLGARVLEQACTAAAAWQPPCRIAVNVSILQLRDGGLQDEVAAILTRSGLPATLLEIEVTESVMADDNKIVLDTLLALKAMGVRIVLDDFGTGYSSLSYLRRFSFDKIKIDKAFVQGQASDRGVRVILESILGMCRNLGVPVVGEGVETRQQLAVLRAGDCAEVQGYLLGKPMPAEMAAALLLRDGRRRGPDDASPAAPREFELAS